MVEPSLITYVFQAIQLGQATLDSTRESLRDALRHDGHSGALVGVSGGGTVDASLEKLAEALGEELARRGAVVITGGLGGVMNAASRGAKRIGGTTIGLLPGADPSVANEHVDHPIATGWQEGRNFLLSYLSDGLIAIDGEYGTLSEVALARKLGRPVVGLRLRDWRLPDLADVDDPGSAVERLWAELEVIIG